MTLTNAFVDNSVKSYQAERTCGYNEVCKEEFRKVFRCKCPSYLYCRWDEFYWLNYFICINFHVKLKSNHWKKKLKLIYLCYFCLGLMEDTTMHYAASPIQDIFGRPIIFKSTFNFLTENNQRLFLSQVAKSLRAFENPIDKYGKSLRPTVVWANKNASCYKFHIYLKIIFRKSDLHSLFHNKT